MVKTRAVAYCLASTTPPPATKREQGEDSIVQEGGSKQIQAQYYPFLEVSQKRIAIPNPTEETVKGPIRLRLLQLPSAVKTDELS